MKSHFSWQVGAQWEFKVIKTIICYKNKYCPSFYKKSVNLDFIHDREINRKTNFYLKVKQSLEWIRNNQNTVVLWNYDSNLSLVENCLVQTCFILNWGNEHHNCAIMWAGESSASKVWSLHTTVCFLLSLFFHFMIDSFTLL